MVAETAGDSERRRASCFARTQSFIRKEQLLSSCNYVTTADTDVWYFFRRPKTRSLISLLQIYKKCLRQYANCFSCPLYNVFIH